jgi:hypothetical protein
MNDVFASVFNFNDNTASEVIELSINPGWDSSDLSEAVVDISRTILWIVKNILSAVIILFLVYAWANMILSFGADEDKLSTSKNQIWYSAIGLLFINIPGSLFSSFYSQGWELNEANGVSWEEFIWEGDRWNLFIDTELFENLFFNEIVRFLEITIFGIAVIVIILAWYKILLARGKDEDISSSRSKILYSVVALFFVGFIEAIKRVVFSGTLTDTGEWTNATWLFSSIAELLLLFAIPIALLFLLLAAFYYITSNGDEEKVKKAKSIVFNTFIATILLIAIYTFILDITEGLLP